MAKEQGAQIVDFRFTDLPGQVQHLSVPVHELTEEKLTEGQPFDGSSIRGFQEIQESDMLLMPDCDTAFMDPFTKHPTMNITCFVKDPVTGEDYSRDPRNIAKKAELYLKQTGIADRSYWGPEAEFYIFDSIRYDQNEFEGYYHVASVAGAWQTGKEETGGNLGYKPRYKGGYFALPPMDKYQDLRTDMVLNLEKVGLTIEVHHHEVGTAGQAEIDMRYDTLLTTADNVMKYKYVVKNTAYQAGKTVTFMPKPLFMDNGSGMHTHQSLWTGDENLFWDEVGYGGISDAARWYIGGLIAHAPSLLAFTNPTTNSYRRLVPATRRRSSWCTASGTAAPAFGSRWDRRARPPSGWSSARRTRRATRTWRSARCSWPGSTASRTRSSRRTRSTRTCTTCRPRSTRP